MKALLRKELVQILPAIVFVALVQAGILAWSFQPTLLLLPSRVDMSEAYWIWSLVAILEGTLLGLLQFRRERSGGTEAYLVHRGTGRSRAFTAKALAGLSALTLLAFAPPGVYGLWHVLLFPSVEHPLTQRLGHIAAVGLCALPGYAIGALCAQLRTRWGIRLVLSLLGMATLSFANTVATFALAGADRTPVPPFAVLQLVVACGVLLTVHALFKAGEDEERPWPGKAGGVATVAVILLTWIPWITFVATSQQVARSNLFTSYPQIVEGAARTLYTVVRVERPDADDPGSVVIENEFRDARGDVVQVDRAAEYDRFEIDLDPFLTLFDASTAWLQQNTPSDSIEPPFWRRVGVYGFDGVWARLNIENQRAWDSWLRVSEGTVYLVGNRPLIHGGPTVAILNRPDTGQPFSDRTLVATEFNRFEAMLLIDRSDFTLWQATGDEPSLDRVSLPDGDRFRGLERLHLRHSVRAGLFDQPRGLEDLLFLGERGRYVWSGGQLHSFREQPVYLEDHESVRKIGPPAWDDWVPQSEVADAIVWRLDPSRSDGLGFRLEVLDAKTGELALAHDYRPESTLQKCWASLAWMDSLARSPAGTLWSHFGAQVEPRNVTRLFTYSSVRDPLLLGGARPGLLAASLGLAIALARVAHRRLGRDPRDRAARRTWTVAILLFGIPAWILFRLLEPSRKQVSARSGPSSALSPILIESPRSAPVPKPALSGV